MTYIDPGTGAMLFTVISGVASAAVYSARNSLVKLRFLLSGGKGAKQDEREPFVIFADDKRYWNVFKPICDEFERRDERLVYMTASQDDPALEEAYDVVDCRFIGQGNRAFATLNQLKADVVLSTTPSLDVFNWKRSKDVKWYIHIPHAASDLTLYRMFGIDYYDAILVSGDYQERQVRQLEEVRRLPAKEIVKTGLTYLDTMASRRQRKEQNQGEILGRPITKVLVAPSWGPNAIFSRFGDKLIDALLATECKIILRPHPQSFTSEKALINRLMKKYPDSDRITWNRDNDNFDVLAEADIMISDFSGVIFDYSLVFDKPVLYTEVDFDDACYDACWLEESPWTFETLPKIGMKLTEDKLADIGTLVEACLNDPSFAQAREEARQQTWAHPGEGSQRAVDYLIEKQRELTDKPEE